MKNNLKGGTLARLYYDVIMTSNPPIGTH